MNISEIQPLIKKVDELRALFILGQKVIPFMEEVFLFISDIYPLLERINNSLSENVQKMPNASMKLSIVTEATELATTEIMDLVDGIFVNLDKIKINNNTNNIAIDTLNKIQIAINNKEDISKYLEDIQNSIKLLQDSSINLANDANISNYEIINLIRNDLSSIMLSLQVQDITSQQIAAVNKLLETLHIKFESILTLFQNSDFSEIIEYKDEDEDSVHKIQVTNLHRAIAFDPNAVDSITQKNNRQNIIDDYINQVNLDEFDNDDNEITSQNDIDKLFESGGF